VKYLLEFEYDRSRPDEIIKLNMDFMKEMEKYPGHYCARAPSNHIYNHTQQTAKQWTPPPGVHIFIH